jgi:hypothetical protein
VKNPYDYNEDGELSAYEYTLFMDEMGHEERDMKRHKSFSSMFDDDFDDDDKIDEDDLDDEFNEDLSDDDSDGDDDWDI